MQAALDDLADTATGVAVFNWYGKGAAHPNNKVGPLTPPSTGTFLNWVPTGEGFHVYVPAVHALGDYLPVTVPWDQISDLMTPAMQKALIR